MCVSESFDRALISRPAPPYTGPRELLHRTRLDGLGWFGYVSEPVPLLLCVCICAAFPLGTAPRLGQVRAHARLEPTILNLHDMGCVSLDMALSECNVSAHTCMKVENPCRVANRASMTVAKLSHSTFSESVQIRRHQLLRPHKVTYSYLDQWAP